MPKQLSAIETIFYKTIFCLLIIASFHFVFLYLSIDIPLFIVYAPTLLYASILINKNEKQNTILYLAGVVFIFFLFAKAAVSWFYSLNGLFIFYTRTYLLTSSLSLFFIPLTILRNNTKLSSQKVDPLGLSLSSQLSIVFIAIGSALFLLFLDQWRTINFDVEPMTMVLGVIVIGILLMSHYIWAQYMFFKKHSEEFQWDETIPVVFQSLIKDNEEAYFQQVHSYLIASQEFLKPGFSLHDLSENVSIPRHHLSELFNAYLGKNFYRLIAEYRVQYFIDELIHKDWTMEAFANECGFNSTTTFNKYFIEITGLTPTEFRKQNVQDGI